ncbi:hypothetical protein Q1695_010972 [Nippostrongylus brasiliensis]|nr:hypothetical protein Q1695_010972 [Nippostrongylus brasiliensis]
MIVFSILLALLQLSQTIADDRESSAKLKRSMLEQDPCLDAEQVYTSGGLQYQWMWAKSLPVKGLRNGTTVSTT